MGVFWSHTLSLSEGNEMSQATTTQKAVNPAPMSWADGLVVSNPAILGGEPCFVGTRVPVATVIAYLEAGHSEHEIKEDYPSLPPRALDITRSWLAESAK